jgi:predicted RNA polymerase sigma factor
MRKPVTCTVRTRRSIPWRPALNRAVALAEVRGPAASLAAVDDLRSSGLDSYYLFHATRAALRPSNALG